LTQIDTNTVGFFGRIKTTTLLDDQPTKRGWKEFLYHAGTAMFSLIFAALKCYLHHLIDILEIIIGSCPPRLNSCDVL